MEPKSSSLGGIDMSPIGTTPRGWGVNLVQAFHARIPFEAKRKESKYLDMQHYCPALCSRLWYVRRQDCSSEAMKATLVD